MNDKVCIMIVDQTLSGYLTLNQHRALLTRGMRLFASSNKNTSRNNHNEGQV